MGIGKVQARAALAAIKAGTNRAQMREQVADAINILNEWLSKRDIQDAEALPAFAVDKAAQFATFVAGLAEPTVDQS